MDLIPFMQLLTYEEFARLLGFDVGTIYSLLRSKGPVRDEILQLPPMRTLANVTVFLVMPPPGVHTAIIDGFDHIRCGRPKVAYAIANALSSGAQDWDSHAPVRLSDADLLWTRALRLAALTHHPDRKRLALNFDEAESLKQDTLRQLRAITPRHPAWAVWRDLAAVAYAYWMTAYGVARRLGDPSNAHRTQAGRDVIEDMGRSDVFDLMKKLPKGSRARAFLAYNALQMASLALDVRHFNVGLHELFKFLGRKRFDERLLPMLRDDSDTNAMLRKEQVASFVEGLLGRGPAANDPEGPLPPMKKAA